MSACECDLDYLCEACEAHRNSPEGKAEFEREYGWMRQYVRDAKAYADEGNHEAAVAIKKMCCS